MAHSHSHHHHHDAAPRAIGPVPQDPAQESLVRALRGSFNILRVLMLVLVVLYLVSGLFRVEPGQRGLVARLGKLRTTTSAEGVETPIFSEGWHLALPDPFDEKITVTGRVQNLVVTTFMFQHEQAATAKNLEEINSPTSSLEPGKDGAMLTGDRNLSHGRWEVQYEIADAADFVQHVGASAAELEPLLRRLTETAVVREVAGRTIEEVTRTHLDSVRNSVQRRLQKSLDELETGVRIVQVVAYTIEPGAVRPAFLDVVNASSEKQRLEDEARQRATEILSRTAGSMHDELLQLIGEYGDAQLRGADEAELVERLVQIDAALERARRAGAGQVAVRLSEAQARADQINESLRSEYKQFKDYLKLREAQPEVTLLGLWTRMREAVLSNRQVEVSFVNSEGEIEIFVPSDMERRIELEEQAALERQRGRP